MNIFISQGIISRNMRHWLNTEQLKEISPCRELCPWGLHGQQLFCHTKLTECTTCLFIESVLGTILCLKVKNSHWNRWWNNWAALWHSTDSSPQACMRWCGLWSKSNCQNLSTFRHIDPALPTFLSIHFPTHPFILT